MMRQLKISFGFAAFGMIFGCSVLSDQQIDREFDDEGTRKFLKCSLEDNLDCLKKARGLFKNNAGKNGQSPLEWYLKHPSKRQLDIVEEFLKAGADPHQMNIGTTNSPYFTAIERHDREMLELFHLYGASPNHRYKSGLWTYPIFMATTSRDVGIVKDLVDAGADIESKNYSEQTPLLSANVNQYDIALELINRGADINVVDKNGNDVCKIFDASIDRNSENYQFRLKVIGRLRTLGKDCLSKQ